jgi:biotin transport system substrate-specific component
MTLTHATLGQDTLLKQALLVLAGSALIAIAAKVAVPLGATSMTLQTLAVLVVGLTFGSRLGAITLVAYLAQGAAGLPMFTLTTAPGLAAFVGPSAGFLLGFVAMAWIAGFIAERGVTSVWGLTLATVAASAALYVPGLAWPALVAGGFGIEAGWVAPSAENLLSWFMLPFLAGDALKAVLAAVIVSGAWAVWRKKTSA